MLSQLPPFGLIFVFSLLLSKPFLFPAANQTCLRKTMISNPFIVKFDYHVRNPIPNILTVGNFKIISELRGKPFAL